MYEPAADADHLAAFGLNEADFSEQSVCEVWAEHWEAVMLFIACETQWRTGMGGITGLDYTAVKTLLEIRQIPPEQWADCLAQIRIMEAEVLNITWERNHVQ